MKLPYVINGLGGQYTYGFAPSPEPGSVSRFTGDHGAMLITINENQAAFKFFTVSDPLHPVDSFSLFLA